MDLSDCSSSFKNRGRSVARGYTLVEVLIASSILAMGLAAAFRMSLAMGTQEEINHRMAMGLSLHENAARLYQLGIDDFQNLLPASGGLVTFSATPRDVDGLNVSIPANLNPMTITATIYPAPESGDNPARTNTLTVFRATVP